MKILLIKFISSLINLFNRKKLIKKSPMKINSFDYKRTYNLPKDKKRRFGVELEVLIAELSKKEKYIGHSPLVQQEADNYGKYFKDWAFYKSDGSLNGMGFEIVTIPLTRNEQFTKWNSDLFKSLSEKLVSYEAYENCCGMHVHVSRENLTLLQIGKVLRFIHNKNNRIFIKKIAQRHETDYAEFKSKKRFADVKPKVLKNKYDALNLGHAETIEFRLFKGTLNYEAFHKNIEFCDAILDFCASCNASIEESLLWWNFTNFVEKNKKYYQFLWSYLVKKEIQNIDSWNKRKERLNKEKENKNVEIIEVETNITKGISFH